MKASRAGLLAALVLLPCVALPDDLSVLVKEYLDAKAKVRGNPDERLGRARTIAAPALKKIGEVDTNESLAFLVQEMDTALPEIGAVCAGPILASKSPNALGLVLKGFPKRNRIVQAGILDALAATPRDISPAEAEIIQIAHSSPEPSLRRRLPAVLRKLESLAAAKALLACVPEAETRGKKREDAAPGPVVEAVFNALKETKRDDVKRWLAAGAFEASRGAPLKLALVARLAGELKLVDAREEIQKLAGHSDQQVSAAAVGALARVGFGDSTDEIVAALEKRKGKDDLPFRMQALDSLAATGSDQALEVVLRFARGSDADMRAVAMGSLGLFKQNRKAVEGIIAGLQDAEPNVRANALKAMASVAAPGSAAREKSMIDPLIRVVEKDSEDRLKVQAVQLLVGLTGQNMGLVGEDWRKWWDVSEARFEFPKDGKKGSTGVRAYDLSYFGIEVSSKKVAFLVDISSSMNQEVPVKVVRGKKKDDDPERPREAKTGVKGGGGNGASPAVPVKDGKARKIDILKRELVNVVKALPPETQINIVTFSRDFSSWQRELQPLAGPGRARAIDYVKGLDTGTGTNVFDTLEFALKDRRADTIYLLSDGEPTAGRIRDIEGISREIRAQNRVRGVTVHCIAFGEDSELLKRLAKENGGEFRFVDQMEL
jgi:hypothetical protein